MFKTWWQRLLDNKKSSTAKARRSERRNHVRLQLDRLEDRLAPAGVNLAAAISGTSLMLTETSSVGIGGNGITITEGATFGELTIGVPAGNSITFKTTNEGTTFTTPSVITAVTVKLGSGADTLTIGDTSFATTLSLPGNLTISGTGGDKILNVDTVSLLGSAKLSVSFTGNGTATSTFEDVNVGGSATIKHPGVGDTTLNILSSGNAAYNWGSTTVSNFAGFDNSAIGDTNFLGNLTINNGPGGSSTNVSATNDKNLANIYGNLTMTTTGGQSTNQLYDYNVRGNVNITTGPATPGAANFVGLENIQTTGGSGVPVINGNVNVTGTAPGGAGLLFVSAGTNVGNPTNPGTAELPLTVLGNVTITANGSGSATITLNDLNVPTGSTAVTLGASTSNDTVIVQAGTGLTSVYDNVTLTSNAKGNNLISIQDQAGTVAFGGAVKVQINVGATTTVEVGADAGNDTGVANALVELFGTTTVKATKAGNTFFGAPGHIPNSNISAFTEPSVGSNFMFL